LKNREKKKSEKKEEAEEKEITLGLSDLTSRGTITAASSSEH